MTCLQISEKSAFDEWDWRSRSHNCGHSQCQKVSCSACEISLKSPSLTKKTKRKRQHKITSEQKHHLACLTQMLDISKNVYA